MSETYSAYLPGIRSRFLQERAAWETRRARAWEAARQIAALLRSEFGVIHVLAFGSLVRAGRFDKHSDIDIAVRGIAALDYYQAVGRFYAFGEFDVDLIDLDYCAPALKANIENEGVEL